MSGIYPDWIGINIDSNLCDTTLNASLTVTVAATEVGVVDNTIDVSASAYSIEMDSADTVVEGYKKEYSIISDGLYASISYDEAPTWLTSIIDTVVDYAVAGSLTDYASLTQDIRDAVSMLDAAANKYVEEINFDASVDAIVASHFITLNATLGDVYATSVELTSAIAATDFSLTTTATEISSAYQDYTDSAITMLSATFTDATAAVASDITALTSVFQGQASEISGISSVISALQTYVGVDDAGASTNTNLTAYLTDSNGVIGGATSNVANSVYTDALGASVSQFEYSSALYKDGLWYTAGFGLDLSTVSGAGTLIDPHSSEFWIDAEKFRFTNTAQSGSVSPFVIDASGPTPQITFNGVVDFTNTNMDSYDNSNVDVSGTISTNNDAMAQRLGYDNYAAMVSAANAGNTIISGGHINTDLLTVQTALVSADGLFSVDMDTKVIRAEDSTGDYVEMTPGELTFYHDGVRYAALRRIDNGVASNNSTIVFSPPFQTTPKVTCSIKNFPTFDPIYSGLTLYQNMSAVNVSPTGFDVRCYLDSSGAAYRTYAPPGNATIWSPSDGDFYTNATSYWGVVTFTCPTTDILSMSTSVYNSITTQRPPEQSVVNKEHTRVEVYNGQTGVWTQILYAYGAGNADTGALPVGYTHKLRFTAEINDGSIPKIHYVNCYTEGTSALLAGEVSWTAIE